MPQIPVTDDELEQAGKPAGPCVMVVFGATGDLTMRKLVPALYNLEKAAPPARGIRRPGRGHRRSESRGVPQESHSLPAGRGPRHRGLGPLPAIPSLPAWRLRRSGHLRQAGEKLGRHRPAARHQPELSLLHGDVAQVLLRDRSATRTIGSVRSRRTVTGEEWSSRSRSVRTSTRPWRSIRTSRTCSRKSRFIGSIIISAKKPCRTSWCSASATGSLSRSGTGATSTTSPLRTPRPWVSKCAEATSTAPAPCATWSPTT